jgi:uncharacterized membrane protein
MKYWNRSIGYCAQQWLLLLIIIVLLLLFQMYSQILVIRQHSSVSPYLNKRSKRFAPHFKNNAYSTFSFYHYFLLILIALILVWDTVLHIYTYSLAPHCAFPQLQSPFTLMSTLVAPLVVGRVPYIILPYITESCKFIQYLIKSCVSWYFITLCNREKHTEDGLP